MRQVKGYMTSDGTFFEEEADAIFHEARNDVALVLSSSLFADQLPFEPLIAFLSAKPTTVTNFCIAYQAMKKLQERQDNARHATPIRNDPPQAETESSPAGGGDRGHLSQEVHRQSEDTHDEAGTHHGDTEPLESPAVGGPVLGEESPL